MLGRAGDRAENGERVRVAFALDCCDREAMSYVATTGGITGKDVRDLMVAAVEHRFGPVDQLPGPIEWLTDNGSCFVARETRRFARDIGLAPRTTPLESPQSNGMAEAFGKALFHRERNHPSNRPDRLLHPQLTSPKSHLQREASIDGCSAPARMEEAQHGLGVRNRGDANVVAL